MGSLACLLAYRKTRNLSLFYVFSINAYPHSLEVRVVLLAVLRPSSGHVAVAVPVELSLVVERLRLLVLLRLRRDRRRVAELGLREGRRVAPEPVVRPRVRRSDKPLVLLLLAVELEHPRLLVRCGEVMVRCWGKQEEGAVNLAL